MQVPQARKGLRLFSVIELRAVPAGELLPFARIMAVPPAQFGRWRYGLQPVIPRRLVLALPARPKPIDEHYPTTGRTVILDMGDVHRMPSRHHLASFARQDPEPRACGSISGTAPHRAIDSNTNDI